MSKLKMLSLGMMIIGIGFIVWAGFHIRAQSQISTEIKNQTTIDTTNELEETSLQTPKDTGQDPKQDIEHPEKDEIEILYPIRPKKGDHIGTLIIPALDKEMPIYHGTDEDELKKGVGHFAQSVLPGEQNNTVLSGHRDTIFRDFGELKVGDTFIVQTSAGKFTYEIKETRIVEREDKSIIVPTNHAVLTVTTCYPFNYIGAAPDRYILIADLVGRES